MHHCYARYVIAWLITIHVGVCSIETIFSILLPYQYTWRARLEVCFSLKRLFARIASQNFYYMLLIISTGRLLPQCLLQGLHPRLDSIESKYSSKPNLLRVQVRVYTTRDSRTHQKHIYNPRILKSKVYQTILPHHSLT